MKVQSRTCSPRKAIWDRSTAAGRWYGFGRYYAMFPQSFIHDAITNLTKREETVLDPFCGRGNAIFAATVLGRQAFGVDINPIAWLFAAAKLQPAPDVEQVLGRLSEIDRARRSNDRRSHSRFETMAWAPAVRALLKAARRELDWRGSIVDRTLMAFMALHMQDKRGQGLSNAMSPTIAYSPTYAVKWWTQKGLSKPPELEPIAVLEDKIRRRYQCGVPMQTTGTVLLGDSRRELPMHKPANAGLLVTSPPYCGVTDYWNDHWIRLWMLGYAMRKNWPKTARYQNQREYQELITGVFRESKRHLKRGAAILVRSDRRQSTARMCIAAMREAWPGRRLLMRSTTAPYPGISAHHGRGGQKAKEVDLFMPASRAVAWQQRQCFTPYREAFLDTIGPGAVVSNGGGTQQ